MNLFVFITLCGSAFSFSYFERSIPLFLKRSFQDENKETSTSDEEQIGVLWEKKIEPKMPTLFQIPYYKDVLSARNKSKIIFNEKRREHDVNSLNSVTSTAFPTKQYYFDPVLNVLRKHDTFRRRGSSESSSRELKDFKEEFHDLWLHKKFEAINQSMAKGDHVNMIAARPWGIQCGDPSQHDMPWGSCMLSTECEPEYRIFRGDFQCGRTQFICCALNVATYDMYQGLDITMEDKGLSTDSGELIPKKKAKKKKSEKNEAKEIRKKDRENRKKRIKKHIEKIVKEIRKILDKEFKNGTKMRRRKTKQLKKFITDLKKQYKKDRKAMKDLHEEEMIKIDNALQIRLTKIRDTNTNFMKNATFREILINGTITKQGARMLLEAYPELIEFMETRRSEGGTKRQGPRDYLEFDVEYGNLYY